MLDQLPYLTYSSPDPTSEEILSCLARSRVLKEVGRGDFEAAREVALAWAEAMAGRLGLQEGKNWKFFKRAVVAKWFGEPERRRFDAGWTEAEVRGYACSLVHNHSIRISIFPETIACHATSIRISRNATAELDGAIGRLDREVPIEVFPESSNDSTICFRRFSMCFNELVIYEAGLGQAMNVFESEQGAHLVARAVKAESQFLFSDTGNSGCATIYDRLRSLVNTCDSMMAWKTFGICRTLGLDFISLEGYYDHSTKAIRMVDLDLPLDLAFLAKLTQKSSAQGGK